MYARALAGDTAWAAPPPAGLAIPNIATGTAVNASGTTLTPSSNTVTAIVAALDAVALTPGRATIAAPGASVVFPHTLANRGNAPADVRLTLTNLSGDAFDLTGFSIVHDLDADGTPGPLEPVLANGSTLALAAGDSAALLALAQVPANAPGLAAAHLRLDARTLALGATASATDTVTTPVTTPPTIAFYAAGDYARTVFAVSGGRPLFVQAVALAANRDPLAPDTVSITLTASLTGDVDVFEGTETGANTGTFRIEPQVPTGFASNAFALSGDGIVTHRRGDLVLARIFGHGAPVTETRVWIDPEGIVFDAISDAPIAGARVRLVDVTGQGNGGDAGGPARVLEYDGVTPAPAELVTDATGRYRFPTVAPSTYRLAVEPPAPLRFPARIAPANLPPGRLVDAVASYGAPFAVSDTSGPVRVDLPVDAAESPAVLFAEKSVSRAAAELGDDLDYTVRIANRTDRALDSLVVRDALPVGFAYLGGTARLDAAPLGEPVRDGRDLVFAIGAIGANATATLRYRVHVGPAALDGDGINAAWAEAGSARSNVASARVALQGGVFAREAGIVGRVYLDADGDRRRGPHELGLAGVKLWLDDGTWAVTDGRGRFSFTGLDPRTRALKLDPSTLPPGAHVVALDHRDGLRAGLRFIDLHVGELALAEFAVVGDTTTLREVQDRRTTADARTGELDRALRRGAGALVETGASSDPRALPATATRVGDGRVATRPAAWAPPSPPATPVLLDQLVPSLDAELGFVGLADLDTVPQAQIVVRVKGRVGQTLRLRVNGKSLPESRVGRRVTAVESGVEAWEYVGVGLEPGINVLEVAPPRSVGRIAVRVVAPGPLERVELSAPRVAPVDGRRPVALVVRTLDAAGIPVGARTLVTLTTTAGSFAADDLDPAQAGTQIAVEGGALVVGLLPPDTPGAADVVALAPGHAKSAAQVRFVPEIRPLLAVGALEGVVRFGQRAPTGPRAPARATSPLESPIDQFRSESRDGHLSAEAHGAMFVKGRLVEDLLLTLGYDSDKPAGLRAFRDLQTDAGPPVLGDGGARGWDAQSTGRLYARLDRHQASFLYGDYVTRTGGETRSLAAYSRSLTGARTTWDDRTARIEAFTSRDRARRGVEELRGLGTSGPYRLAVAPIVENSERVEIIVRDRNQPSVVLSSQARQRFSDYEIEPFTGRIVLRAPLPSVDADLNPIYLRVAYESPSGGEPFWVHGVDARWKTGERIEVGGSYVDDHEPDRAWGLRSAFVTGRLPNGVTWTAEGARTQRAGARSGDAGRFEIAREGGPFEGRLWASATGSRFDNAAAGFGAGRTEAGAHFAKRLAERSRLSADALFTADAAGAERRGGLLLAIDRRLSEAARGELGVRLSGERRRTGVADPFAAALRGKLSAQWPRHPEWTGFAELEQDTRDWDRRLAAIGGEVRTGQRARIYARHELASTLTGAWALATTQRNLATVVGVDADVLDDAHVFGEYRLADAFAGRDAQAAVGLRNGWSLPNGLRLGTSFERTSPLAGASQGPSTALTASVDWSDDPQWKGSSRFEVRSARTGDTFLQSLAAAVKLDSAWTGLIRHHLTLGSARAGGEARERFQLAGAWRPAGAWNALGRWEFRYDRDKPDVLGGFGRRRRIANVLSTQATGRLDERLVAAFTWAGKLTHEREAGFASANGAQWLQARGTLDLARGWDVGAAASVWTGRSVRQRRYGLGAEVGRQLPGDAWLSLGWNLFGYEDEELTGDSWSRAGGYLRLRMKVDERLWPGAGRDEVRP